MKHKEYDIVVVGAGPGGSVISRHLAQLNYRVLLLEKRKEVGIPVRCGEASTSLKDMETFGPFDDDCIETVIDGLFVYGPGGTHLDVYKKNTGIMLNREKFDPCLARLAEKDGVELVLQAKCESISPVVSGYREIEVTSPLGKSKIKTKMLVGADGIESLVGRMAGLKSLQLHQHTCTGINFEVEGILTEANYLTFWQGQDFINDGYIWSFPKLKSNTTNFGAGYLIPKSKGKPIKEVTLEWLEKLFPGAKIKRITGGLIPVSGNLKDYVADRLILVGDAAHHTNPLTGGGISAAMKAGREGALVIHQAFQEQNFSKAFFKQYQDRCEKIFGKKHKSLLKFRRFLLGLPKNHQIEFYKVIKAFVENNYNYWALLKHPILTIKSVYRYYKSSH